MSPDERMAAIQRANALNLHDAYMLVIADLTVERVEISPGIRSRFAVVAYRAEAVR